MKFRNSVRKTSLRSAHRGSHRPHLHHEMAITLENKTNRCWRSRARLCSSSQGTWPAAALVDSGAAEFEGDFE